MPRRGGRGLLPALAAAVLLTGCMTKDTHKLLLSNPSSEDVIPALLESGDSCVAHPPSDFSFDNGTGGLVADLNSGRFQLSTASPNWCTLDRSKPIPVKCVFWGPAIIRVTGSESRLAFVPEGWVGYAAVGSGQLHCNMLATSKGQRVDGYLKSLHRRQQAAAIPAGSTPRGAAGLSSGLR